MPVYISHGKTSNGTNSATLNTILYCSPSSEPFTHGLYNFGIQYYGRGDEVHLGWAWQ